MNQQNPKTMVDEIFQLILSDIIEGRIAQGEPVNELAIAKKLDVSRGPVREAVKRIEGVGLIRKEPFMKARVIELTLANMIEVFQMREAVEAMSVRLATQVMPDADIGSLMQDFSEVSEADENRSLDIHVRIAKGCGNERIRSYLCDELYYLLRMYRYRSTRTPGRRETALGEHWQILKAMKDRDADLAEFLMRGHISRATRSLQIQLAQQNADMLLHSSEEALQPQT